MSDKYITLMGAEQVQSAASSMRSAASDMQRAANNISDTFLQHQHFMEQWLQNFESVLNEHKPS